MKLSLIGGGCGLVSLLVIRLVSYVTRMSLTTTIFMGGVFFVPTGVGTAISLWMLGSPLLISKKRLFLAGIIGGFLCGIGVSLGPFFLGGYFAFVFLGLALGIGMKNIKMGLKVIGGALLGALLGAVLNTLLSIAAWSIGESFITSAIFSSIIAFILIPLNLYFLNFGVLFVLMRHRIQQDQNRL